MDWATPISNGAMLAAGGALVAGLLWLSRRGFVSAVNDQLMPLEKRIRKAFDRADEIHGLLADHLVQEAADVRDIREDIETIRKTIEERDRTQKWYRS